MHSGTMSNFTNSLIGTVINKNDRPLEVFSFGYGLHCLLSRDQANVYQGKFNINVAEFRGIVP